MLIFYIFVVYFLPGLAFLGVFNGKLRKQPLFILLLSFISGPFLYLFLAEFSQIHLWPFIAESLFVAFLIHLLTKNPSSRINIDAIFPQVRIGRILVLFIVVFWLMNTIPRIGLLRGDYPIGDDSHRLSKTVAVAESPGLPLFYNFPLTRLTIYYFVTVGSGLLVNFSHNAVRANLAWFIHVSLWDLAMLYLLALAARNLFKKTLAQFVFFSALTFFSGYEIYVAILKGVNPLTSSGWTDLEWWTDWFGRVFNIHLQISSPYTSFFWVPQHLFAALLALPIFLLLKSSEIKKTAGRIGLGFLFATIFGYSLFVFVPVALAYSAVEFVNLLTHKERLSGILKQNLTVGLVFLILSSDLINLYLNSEKKGWFSLRLNNFFIFDNHELIGKIINLLLTIPLFLTVEYGGLSILLLYTIRRMLRFRLRENIDFWYFCIFPPLVATFFLRAADDNNIALRSTLPALIGLAVLAGNLFETISGWPKRLLILSLLLSLPTTAFLFLQRSIEQFTFNRQHLSPIYQKIDETTPLNSVIFSSSPERSEISVLAHRFTFKPIETFDIADKEYSPSSKLEMFADLDLTRIENVQSFLNETQKKYHFLRGYRFFYLSSQNLPLKILTESGADKLYVL